MIGWRAILACELRKLRRTPAFGLVILTPYLPLLAFFFFALVEGERFLRANPVSAWIWLADATLHAWALLLLPLFVSLLATTAAAVEHRAEGVKQLFVQPVARWRLYAGKQLVLFGLVGAAYLMLLIGIGVSGMVLRFLRPGLGFEDPVPWLALIGSSLSGFVASGFLVALLAWVSLVREEFATPMGLGVLALATHLALLPAGRDWTAFHPASWPVEAARGLAAGEWGTVWAAIGLVGGVALSALAGMHFIRRDVL